MARKTVFISIILGFIFLLFSSCSPASRSQRGVGISYVSDMKIIHSGGIHAGVGKDAPYWGGPLIICDKQFDKGLLIHPKNDGSIGFAEFLLPDEGGHLLGLAGWAEQAGVHHSGRMRYRFFVDGDFIYGGIIAGEECQDIDLNLGHGRVLRIETDDGGDGYYADHMAFGDLRVAY